MPNTNDIHIDVSLVRELIKTQFPEWENLKIKPVEFSGWDNRTFHLGEQMTVRLPSNAEYSGQVEKEQYWLPKLAPHLTVAVPEPLAMGKPSKEYPWHWSVYKWLKGDTAAINRINDLNRFAIALAEFLVTLQGCDATGGPLAGEHNFYRGGNLAVYDRETREAIKLLNNKIDTQAATKIWESALASTWQKSPVWVHGDIATGNLLVNDGRLSAVIDFGQLGLGDPACDLAIAWTFFKDESRNVFQEALKLDQGTWARGQGWALWKALIVCAGLCGVNPGEAEKSKMILNELLADYQNNS
ncbi:MULTISPECIES: aminoglycoside phosphotransferase family protein [unclassified Legionella]|uniref:aminoglycoside phosphotransferase family protein n=1 Tax=unclassified Legionella TaxID=2622702 RepID=UPI001054E45A|nr:MULTISPECIES: aminoglycoside phosphotransferase family protein [unclassified Legionella]MDI9819765.1 aminoglycoside phosphotransferase family protein [Legionella sp. PL877]